MPNTFYPRKRGFRVLCKYLVLHFQAFSSTIHTPDLDCAECDLSSTAALCMLKSTFPLKWKKGLFCFVQQQMFGLKKYLCGNISHTLHVNMQIWVCVSDSPKHPALYMYVCLLMASSWESSHKEALLY